MVVVVACAAADSRDTPGAASRCMIAPIEADLAPPLQTPLLLRLLHNEWFFYVVVVCKRTLFYFAIKSQVQQGYTCF